MATRSLKRFPFYPFWCQHVHNGSHQIPKQAFSSVSWRAETIQQRNLEFRTCFLMQLKVEFWTYFYTGRKTGESGKKRPLKLECALTGNLSQSWCWMCDLVKCKDCTTSLLKEPNTHWRARGLLCIKQKLHPRLMAPSMLTNQWTETGVRKCTGGRKRGNRKCGPPVTPPPPNLSVSQSLTFWHFFSTVALPAHQPHDSVACIICSNDLLTNVL